MSKLLCLVKHGEWAWPGLLIARMRLFRVLEAQGVEFVRVLGEGYQSLAVHVRIDGGDYCLKVSYIDNSDRYRYWDQNWGTRPFDLVPLAKRHIEVHGYNFMVLITELGERPTEQEARDVETHWRWMGVIFNTDLGAKQWVKLKNGELKLVDYGCAMRYLPGHPSIQEAINNTVTYKGPRFWDAEATVPVSQAAAWNTRSEPIPF